MPDKWGRFCSYHKREHRSPSGTIWAESFGGMLNLRGPQVLFRIGGFTFEVGGKLATSIALLFSSLQSVFVFPSFSGDGVGYLHEPE